MTPRPVTAPTPPTPDATPREDHVTQQAEHSPATGVSRLGTPATARDPRPAVELVGMSRRFAVPGGETVNAVDAVDLTVHAGEFFTLLGPSGSGKTTMLRCVAGLERPDGGEIRINGMRVAGPGTFVPPQGRAIGMVFQSYAIWPHLTVFDNVAFPLRQLPRKQRPSAERVRSLVLEALDVVGLSVQAERSSTRLSGGQQQRVAIARAIVGRPEVLLLDEPLSNLDAVLRAGMRVELRRLTKELGITALYVTHDQTEALEMSDRIAVVAGGHVLQCGSPTDIYRQPADPFVAEFVGRANRIDGTVRRMLADRPGDEPVAEVDTPLGALRVTVAEPLAAGQEVQVVVRPESLHVTRQRADDGFNYIEARVEHSSFAGAHSNVIARCPAAPGLELLAEVHHHDEVSEGDTVLFRFGPRWCTAVPRPAGAAAASGAAAAAGSAPPAGAASSAAAPAPTGSPAQTAGGAPAEGE